jgi:hypothetical protein
VRDFRNLPSQNSAGKIYWKQDGSTPSINFAVTCADGSAVITLTYLCGTEDVRIPLRLVRKASRFGSDKWWFRCPLIVEGVVCGRSVGKLYLPPGAKYFGCRHCHKLSYRSSQQAHRDERASGRHSELNVREYAG